MKSLALGWRSDVSQHSYFVAGDPPPCNELPQVVQKAFKKAGKNQVYAPAEDVLVPNLQQKVVGENGVVSMQPRIQVGYMGKPKDVMPLAWERGLVTEGMSSDQAIEALEACPDYFNENHHRGVICEPGTHPYHVT